jgi:hypothetical protein
MSMKLSTVCAVAALAATALPCPASAYCRGCVIEPAPAVVEALALSAHAEAPPIPQASCHTEVQKRWSKGRARFRRIEICE